jgi:dipeptidase E
MTAGRRIGFIPNAMDAVPQHERESSNAASLWEVQNVGIAIETLDLRLYFGAAGALAEKLDTFDGVWVRGGNTFVLRQAMRLSGFDDLVANMRSADFFYGGYSAGVCVLAPRLDGLQQVDDPSQRPYSGSEVILDGLGLLSYLILPHFESDHPESAAIDKEVEYCRDEGISFRTLRDGEVIIIENLAGYRSA